MHKCIKAFAILNEKIEDGCGSVCFNESKVKHIFSECYVKFNTVLYRTTNQLKK